MEGVSKGRLLAFRIVAGLTAVLCLLPIAYAVISFTDAKSEMHRVHNTSMAILLALCAAVPLFISLKDPSSRVAPFRVFMGVLLAGVVSGIIAGDLLSPEGPLILIVLGVVAYALNPAMAQVNRCVKANVAQLIVAVVAFVPGFMHALSQGDLQRTQPEANEHVKYHHYAGMGWIAMAVALCGIAASFQGTGKRLAGWLVGASAVLLGLLALIQPDYEGAFDTPWAIALIVYGIVYAALGEAGARRGDAVPVSAPDTAKSEV